MSIAVTCEHCGAVHSVHERMNGRDIRCPGCDEIVRVVAPEPPDVADEPAEAEAVTAELGERWATTDETDEVALVAEAVPVQGIVQDSSSAGTHSTDRVVQEVKSAWAVGEFAGNPSDDGGSLEEDDDDDLATQLFAKKPREEEELDMTPMVDVTFLLLIFFMVTASFSLQKSIEMPRQTSDQASTTNTDIIDEMDAVDLEIDEFGGFLVIAPDFEAETPGKKYLTSKLREAIVGRRDGMKLNIKVHEMAKLQALVDGMDAGTIAGFSEIKVTQVDGFD
ncbi:MAG: biopolymer transporter ExbD [Planctomycetota bacterium]